DYLPHERTPMVAIGNAKVIGSDQHSGWPGGAFLYYKLVDGDHEGAIIYIAEHIKHLVPKGRVEAGERLGFATPGSTGIETGWATPDGQPRAGTCYHEGQKTNSGKEMARFLHPLGAKLEDKPGSGPDYPAGKRCLGPAPRVQPRSCPMRWAHVLEFMLSREQGLRQQSYGGINGAHC